MCLGDKDFALHEYAIATLHNTFLHMYSWVCNPLSFSISLHGNFQQGSLADSQTTNTKTQCLYPIR